MADDRNIEQYLAIASEDMQDGKGIWSIAKGSRIITDPVSGISEPDTESNRAAFVKNNFSWRKPERKRFSLKAKLDSSVDNAIGVMKDFSSNLDANLRALSSTYCFPNINLPFSARLVPWQLKVRKADLLDDISKQWVSAQVKDGLTAVEDEELSRLCNSFRIYELRNGCVKFIVAAIFVSAIDNGKASEYIDSRFAVCAENLLEEYQHERCRFSSASATFCVFGAAAAFSDQIKARLSHDTVGIIAQKPVGSSSWDIEFPAVNSDFVWYNFIGHLSPMSPEEKLEYVKAAIERIRLSTLGNITLEKIAAETGWPWQSVLIEVDRLCREGGYKYQNNSVIVDKNIAPGHGALGLKNSWVFGYYNNLVSTLCFSIGCKLLVNQDMSNRYQISTIAGLALFSYIGSLLSADRLRKVACIGIKRG